MCDSMGWRKQPGDKMGEIFTKICVNRFKTQNKQGKVEKVHLFYIYCV